MAWMANVWVSSDSSVDWKHVYCKVNADNEEEAKLAATYVLERLAAGKKAVIRNEPYAQTYIDYESNNEVHHGFARFSVSDEPGAWVNQRGDTV